RRMPSGVVLAVAADADGARARAQRTKPIERSPHLGLVSHDPDELLHHLLQRVLHLKRSFAAGAALERLDRMAGRFVDLPDIDGSGLVRPRELRRELAGALAEHEQ